MMVRATTSRADWPFQSGEYEGIPALPTGDQDENGNDIYQPPLAIGPGASEFPGDENTAPSGRIFTEFNFNELHLDYLDAQGVFTITHAGTFTGDTYPFPEEEI